MAGAGPVRRMRESPGYAEAKALPETARLAIVTHAEDRLFSATRWLWEYYRAQGVLDVKLKHINATVKCVLDMNRLGVWE